MDIGKDPIVEKLIQMENELGTDDPIVRELMAMFAARSREGARKYGTTLARTDLDREDWLRHSLEEMMDNCLYMMRALKDLEGEKEMLSVRLLPDEAQILDTFCDRKKRSKSAVVRQLIRSLRGWIA